LNEIIAGAVQKSADCKSVWDIYFNLIREFNNEHQILTEVPILELNRFNPERLGLGVERMRKGELKIVPGHDGCYGKINLFEQETDTEEGEGQLKLF